MSWAVVLGDIVGSTKHSNTRDLLLDTLNDTFHVISTIIDPVSHKKRIDFEIYRGDSFQGIIYRPVNALKAAIFLRASVRALSKTGPDCRIAIGIGGIEYREAARVGLLDGDAFRAAAQGLEELQSNNGNLAIKISDVSEYALSRELDTECTLADAIIGEWKDIEAEAVKFSLICTTQREIADKIGVTQGAVSQRLQNARFPAIESFLQRYDEIARNNFRNSELNG